MRISTYWLIVVGVGTSLLWAAFSNDLAWKKTKSTEEAIAQGFEEPSYSQRAWRDRRDFGSPIRYVDILTLGCVLFCVSRLNGIYRMLEQQNPTAKPG